jgi:hypothetical protein
MHSRLASLLLLLGVVTIRIHAQGDDHTKSAPPHDSPTPGWLQVGYAYVDPSLESEAVDFATDQQAPWLVPERATAYADALKRLVSQQAISHVEFGVGTKETTGAVWLSGTRSWVKFCQQHRLPYRVALFDEEKSEWQRIRFNARLDGDASLTIPNWDALVLREGGVTTKINGLKELELLVQSRLRAMQHVDWRVTLQRDAFLGMSLPNLFALLRILNKDPPQIFYQVHLPG